MKKIIFILILLLTSSFAMADVVPMIRPPFLLDKPQYSKIRPDNIKSVNIIKYTEAGASETKIDDIEQINQIYYYLKSIVLSGQTTYGCTDNTTVYSIFFKDDTNTSIEIECEWIVIDGKHYKYRILPHSDKTLV